MARTRNPESTSDVKNDAYEYGVDICSKHFNHPKNPKKFKLKEFHRVVSGSYLCGKISLIEDVLQMWEEKGNPNDMEEFMGDFVMLLHTNFTAFKQSTGNFMPMKHDIESISKKIGLIQGE